MQGRTGIKTKSLTNVDKSILKEGMKDYTPRELHNTNNQSVRHHHKPPPKTHTTHCTRLYHNNISQYHIKPNIQNEKSLSVAAYIPIPYKTKHSKRKIAMLRHY
jgi:hypothetical protein